MHPFIIAIPLLLIIPAIYWLCVRKAHHGTAEAMRPEHKEPQELTGTEQAKHREPK